MRADEFLPKSVLANYATNSTGKTISEAVTKTGASSNTYDYEWDPEDESYHVTKNGVRIGASYKAKSKFDAGAADEAAKKHAKSLRNAEIAAEKKAREYGYQYNKPLSELEKLWVELDKKMVHHAKTNTEMPEQDLKKYLSYGQVVRKSLLDHSHPAMSHRPDHKPPVQDPTDLDEGVLEDSTSDSLTGVTFNVTKSGRSKIAITMWVGSAQAGVFQYNAATGRSIVEVFPGYQRQGLGKVLVCYGIYVAAMSGMQYQEDESTTADFDNVINSLESEGFIVSDDDGNWYVTDTGAAWLQSQLGTNLREGVKDWITAAGIGMMAAGGGGAAYDAYKANQLEPQAAVASAPKPAAPLPPKKMGKMESVLANAAQQAGIVGDELRQFLAQCAHESANFTALEEIGSPKYLAKKYDKRYNPKKARVLGNAKPGDGVKYKGRGFIQLTGRYNYARAGNELGLPLEQRPELAARPDIAAQIAVWFWKHRVQPQVQDFTDVPQSTKPINPGMSGLKSRQDKFNQYQQVSIPDNKSRS